MNTKIVTITYLLLLLLSMGCNVSADSYDTMTISMIPGGIPILVTNESTLVEETTVTMNGYLIDDASHVCQYRFQYDADSGAPYAFSTAWAGAIATGTEFNQPVAALTEGELYFFRAQCRNVNGINSSNNEKRFLTKPDMPTNFQAVRDLGITQINLTWVNGAGADKSVIVRKIGAYPVDLSDGIVVYNGTTTSYEDGAVIHGTHYFYRIWSYCAEGGLHQYSDDFDGDSIIALAPATFDIRDIVVSDDIINDLGISVIVENRGGVLVDITVSWVLSRVDTGVVLDMGSDTFAVAPFSLVIYAITPSTAYVGQVLITFVGYGASASEMFTTKASTPPGGGGAPSLPPTPAPPAPGIPVAPSAMPGWIEWPVVVLFIIFVSFFFIFFILYRRKKKEEKKKGRKRKKAKST